MPTRPRSELATRGSSGPAQRALLSLQARRARAHRPEGLAPGVSAAEESWLASRIAAHEQRSTALRAHDGADFRAQQAITEIGPHRLRRARITRQRDARPPSCARRYACDELRSRNGRKRVTRPHLRTRVQMDEGSKAKARMAMISRDIAAAMKISALCGWRAVEPNPSSPRACECWAKAERREALQEP